MEKRIDTISGIPVYSYLNPHLHKFCLCMYVKGGSMYERKTENGISHFFEHVVIRNINVLMEGGLYQVLDRLGLSFNGCTYKEFIQFSISGASCHFQEAAGIFARLLDPLVLSEKEVRTERKRIRAEIREYDEKDSIERRMEKLVWKGTSLAREIAGKRKIIDRIGKNELSAYREKLLSRGNVFFYVTGQCRKEDLGRLVSLLDTKRLSCAFPRRMNLAPVPEPFFRRKPELCFLDGETTEVSISFDVDTLRYTDACQRLFFDMLFAGDCCPFYQELSEKTGYIYSYEEEFERYQNIGAIRVSYEVATGKLLKAFDRTIEIFRQAKRSAENLQYVRVRYEDNRDMELDDAADFNWNRAYDCHILEMCSTDREEEIRSSRQVTEEDMTRMAEEIFRTNNMTVAVKGKKSREFEKKLRQIMNRLDA